MQIRKIYIVFTTYSLLGVMIKEEIKRLHEEVTP